MTGEDGRRRPDPRPRFGPGLPATVWALGLTSLLMDASSEMIHALLPVFLTGTLGASALVVGLVEGLGEAVAAVCKLIGGRLADRLGRRKPVVVAGYGLAALSKPLFALAVSPALVIAARVIDRIGKGLRGAPRDALIADWVDEARRGAAFGLRQSLDTVGALLGPLLASLLVVAFAGDLRAVFLVAVVPAGLSVAVLLRFVRERDRPAPEAAASATPPRRALPSDIRMLPARFWLLVLIGALLMGGRAGEAFLLLAAGRQGMASALVPLVFVAMNAVYAASAYPAGRLADRIGAGRLFAIGGALLLAADLMLAAGAQGPAFWAAVAVWGLHMGLTQSLLAALVSATLPEEKRATGFGVFHMLFGLAALAAGLLAGRLWDVGGPAATYAAAAALAGTTLLLALAVARPARRAR
ncbi:MAG: MFS transporter [Rhodothalassiaceae bacterium]|nr:MAG: MFS transporter [Rhodothalassiaceae bacterium]